MVASIPAVNREILVTLTFGDLGDEKIGGD